MPELLDAYERDEHYFGAIRLEKASFHVAVEFGVPYRSYVALKRILSHRPFDSMPGLHYRHFYVWQRQSIQENQSYEILIRIELGRDAAQCAFEVPADLALNLEWFLQLQNPSELAHLHQLEGLSGLKIV